MGWTGAVLAILALLVTILIVIWDWNWFRGPLERGRVRPARSTIAGDLNVNLWSWRPSATVDGISIANPPWAGAGEDGHHRPAAGARAADPTAMGQAADIRVLAVDTPELLAAGRRQGPRKTGTSRMVKTKKPMDLPPIQRFVIRDGQLRYLRRPAGHPLRGDDQRPREAGRPGNGASSSPASGTINGAPFRAEVMGGPLLNIERTKPYPFDVDLRAGRTYITARARCRSRSTWAGST
ncbi:MAG: hypothetical protein QM775_32630 [Pirellulales bacterium]